MWQLSSFVVLFSWDCAFNGYIYFQLICIQNLNSVCNGRCMCEMHDFQKYSFSALGLYTVMSKGPNLPPNKLWTIMVWKRCRSWFNSVKVLPTYSFSGQIKYMFINVKDFIPCFLRLGLWKAILCTLCFCAGTTSTNPNPRFKKEQL